MLYLNYLIINIYVIIKKMKSSMDTNNDMDINLFTPE